MSKARSSKPSFVFAVFVVGFTLGIMGMSLVMGKWTFYDALVFIGYSFLGCICGLGIGIGSDVGCCAARLSSGIGFGLKVGVKCIRSRRSRGGSA